MYMCVSEMYIYFEPCLGHHLNKIKVYSFTRGLAGESAASKIPQAAGRLHLLVVLGPRSHFLLVVSQELPLPVLCHMVICDTYSPLPYNIALLRE